jgi:hypothetical protein
VGFKFYSINFANNFRLFKKDEGQGLMESTWLYMVKRPSESTASLCTFKAY